MSSLIDLWSDLHEVTVWWQLAVVALSAPISYLAYRFLMQHFPSRTHLQEEVAMPSFTSVLFPTILCALLYLGKVVLLKWQHTHLLSLLILISGLWALIRTGFYFSRRMFVRTRPIGRVHLLIERVFSSGVLLVTFLYYTGYLYDIVVFMERTTITVGRNRFSIEDILQAVVSVVIVVILALFASAVLERRLLKAYSLHTSLRIVLSRLGRSLFIVLAVLISLESVGIDITVLSVFGGALGVGLGIGLQKIASNYVSGLVILLDRSLSINDLITVDKYSGRVSKINTRYTVLKGLDGVESIIPNEMLVSSAVQNLSFANQGIWVSTHLIVAHDADIELLLPLLIEVAGKVEGVSEKSSPSANLIALGVNGFELSIGVLILNPSDKTKVLSQVNRAIWKLLQERNIKLPCPKTEIRVLASELKN